MSEDQEIIIKSLGRPRKSAEDKLKTISLRVNKVVSEEKRKEHNEKMKQYYKDNKERILLRMKNKYKDTNKAETHI
jgi:hypothetical protein